MPATIKVSRVWRGPDLDTIQIHTMSNCGRDFVMVGEPLRFALIRADVVPPPDMSLLERLKLLFRSDLWSVLERFRELFTTRTLYTTSATLRSTDDPYFRELRRLVGAPPPKPENLDIWPPLIADPPGAGRQRRRDRHH